MSSIVLKLSLAAAAACTCLAALAGSAGTVAKDPVFGLSYKPAQVSFDAVPQDVAEACPSLVNERWSRKLWVYAQTEQAPHRYYVLGGFYVRRAPPAKRESLEVDPMGAVVDLHGNQCELLGPAREVFDSRPDELPAASLELLAADLVERYARAFGGRAALVAELKRQRVEPGPKSTVLRQALQASAPAGR